MASQQPQLSNALRLTNVNDFLTPAANCVLPLGGGAAPAGSVLAPIVPTALDPTGNDNGSAPAEKPVVASVTVSDCLSCSGCVTSADTVLLSTASVDALRAFASTAKSARGTGAPPDKYGIAVLSQQSVASLAHAHDLPLAATARRLTTFLRGLGFDAVLDGSFARHFSLLESAAEFVSRRRAGKSVTIASACPGWLTYAEKTQPPAVLDALSDVRSPQAVAGALARRLSGGAGDKRPVWVLSVAPCHDRKLEATRPEFDEQVSCVVTTGELSDLLAEHNFDLTDARETALTDWAAGTTDSDAGAFGVAVGSGSDGYADFVLRHAARELLGVELGREDVHFEKASRSGDIRVAGVSAPDGSSLRFATAYGFRSLQSVLRKLRATGDCGYDYIELMACPGGCNNGGGQMPRVDDADDSRRLKVKEAEFLAGVEERFGDAPTIERPLEVKGVRRVYDEVFGGAPGSKAARAGLSIRVQSRQGAAVTPASLEW